MPCLWALRAAQAGGARRGRSIRRPPAPVRSGSTSRPYLERQIELLQPKLVVALGRPAAQTLLEKEVKISAARGQLFKYRDIPLIVTYHPAYLLRTLTDKAKAWEDLCLARRTMQELTSVNATKSAKSD